MVYIYNWILLKEWNNASDEDYHTKWNKSDRKRLISYDITHVWYVILKMIQMKKIMTQMNLFTKQEQIYRYQKQTHVHQKGNKVGEE